MDEKLEKYPKTDKFQVIDTTGVPHPYGITPSHIAHSSGMYLDPVEAEKKGAKCFICKGLVKDGKQDRVLSYEEHEQALLIEVETDKELEDVEGLQEYLLSIKDMTEKDGFAGFAFKQKRPEEKAAVKT